MTGLKECPKCEIIKLDAKTANYYETEVIPQKVKEAVYKLHKQWEMALSKSKRRERLIKYYEEEVIPQKIKEAEDRGADKMLQYIKGTKPEEVSEIVRNIIKAAEKKLIDEIEPLLPFCPCYQPNFSDCEGCIHENKTDTVTRFKFNGEIKACKDLVWQQLKQSRGIE